MNKNVKYYMWLSNLFGAASTVPDALISNFDNSAEKLWLANEEELRSIPDITEECIRRLKNNSDLTEYDKIIEYCEYNNVYILCPEDAKYPTRLKVLKDRPMVLYCKGKLFDIDENVCIGAVGTRNPTSYGQKNAYTMAYDLAKQGVIVVSGMAYGCDSAAHRGALDCGGSTIAVLGCGIDVVYPAAHRSLMEEIIENGCVMTEYAPGTAPRGYNFPKRNRIISGLCNGVLVIEAPRMSGALITAETAANQGRDVFALPGKVGEDASIGTNKLIQDGAIVALTAEDIVSQYRNMYSSKLRSETNAKQAVGTLKQALMHLHRSDIIPEPYFKREKADKKQTHDNSFAPSRPDIQYKQNDVKHKASDDKTSTKPAAEQQPATAKAPLSGSKKQIFEVIYAKGKASIDDIIEETRLSASEVSSALTLLEIKGYIDVLPGGLAVFKE